MQCHIIGVHEGHNLISDQITKEDLQNECCGGVTTFNFCPFCGEDVKEIIEKIQTTHPLKINQ